MVSRAKEHVGWSTEPRQKPPLKSRSSCNVGRDNQAEKLHGSVQVKLNIICLFVDMHSGQPCPLLSFTSLGSPGSSPIIILYFSLLSLTSVFYSTGLLGSVRSQMLFWESVTWCLDAETMPREQSVLSPSLSLSF